MGQALAIRTEVFDDITVKGSEFLRRVKAVGRKNELKYQWVPSKEDL